MIHLAGAPVTDSQRSQLVIGPKGPIEQKQVHTAKPFEQRLVQISASRHIGAARSAALVEEAQSYCMAGCVHPRKSWWSSGHLERFDHNSAGLSIAIKEGDPFPQRHLVNVHSGKRLSERKDSGVLFQRPSHR